MITAAICFIVMIVTYRPQASYRKGMLFAISLPEHAIVHDGIREIQAGFKRRFARANWLMLLLLVPVAILYALPAYQTVYYLLWICVYFVVGTVPFRRAFREMLALKRDNDWFVGEKRVIQSDLRVAQLKNRRSAPVALFAIPAAMSAGLMVWMAQEGSDFIGLGVAAGLVTVLFLLISLGTRRAKARVYSMNSDVNVSLNQARRRAWSYLWLMMAIVENIHVALIYQAAANGSEDGLGVWLTITLAFTAIPLGSILYVHRKVRALEQELLEQDDKIVYTDDDEYWANGFTYHNPNDKSLLVPKRIGIGETINTGTLAGKLIAGGVLGLLAAVVVGVSFMLIRSELTSPTMTLMPDSTVSIDYPMYSFDFSLSDIQELSLVDEIPSGTKLNGEATGTQARGHFRLKGLGKTRLYVFKNNPPYIRIKLDKVYIFYNDKDPLRTAELFEELARSAPSSK
ncbi:DUF5808 domain-containing protein [Cohnella sp.]|uniref:DUF5808 domain-containing protein n=1 Tax=Cohnella sp. TaxID=1883426 RepID=UPI00370496AB